MEFLSTNALYLVLCIALICWLGIMGFMLKMDKRISALEQQHGKDHHQ